MDKKETRGGYRENSGRKRDELNFVELDKLLFLQCELKECAEILKIKAQTIQNIIKREKKMTFSEYKDTFTDQLKVHIRRQIIDLAVNQADKSAIFFCAKHYLGMGDKVEISQKDNKPFRIKFSEVKKERGKPIQ